MAQQPILLYKELMESEAISTLPSTPDTVLWGYLAANVPAALTIDSGATVRIDTVSHQGLTTAQDPVIFFTSRGIDRDDVLTDANHIYAQLKRPKGGGVHILTGPIYVQDAEPGDMLEVRILDIEFRVPYGVNNTGPGRGVLPDLLQEPTPKLLRLNFDRNVAEFSDEIAIPLRPFMGIMAVSPPENMGMVSSTPPGVWGGNMDLKVLYRGSTLYLPVFNDGAQFFTGDGHAAQGDGEVDGGAIEVSLSPTLQFILHKEKHIASPRAETSTHFVTMGMHVDLNEATRLAVRSAVDFLAREKHLSEADAYALASLAIDFRIGEAVDIVNLVYASIPKALFQHNARYWNDG